ncbi:hypothetical protein ACFQ1R_11380 [Mariniflexile jejuense]|uniref:Uncharacterized protein n=1 Tax=Mariniflexile jejuense TaxID=1173582 RepID=A0ABW3JKP4_9FLAO
MKNTFLILLIFSTLSCLSQSVTTEKAEPDLENLISDFVSTDWGKVYKAKDSLLNIGKQSIPYLIKLLDNPKDFKKLENTADLIYPGATEFYGHDWFINYDLDWIAIRAGWALENLTSQNFGFTENVITEKELIELHKKNYSKYIENGKHDVNFERTKFKELDIIIKRVKDWWKENENGWTALNGLKKAIFSEDINRQLAAIQQMRYPRFKIKGYNQEWFDREIRDRIIELNKTDNEELKLQTGYLIRE